MTKFLRLLIVGLFWITPQLYAEPAETDWLELMPKEDQQALENMPELVLHDSPEEPGAFQAKGGLKQRDDLPAVMYSKNTVASLEGKEIKLGGYPVPIENNQQGLVTQLFIVPYPGACIHVPPPPPNQIVLIDYPQGVQINDIYEPIWAVGKLHIEQVSNDLADAVYTMQANNVRLVQASDL